ncbi:MAG: biosynthetic arginine decarboxylase, partial [Gemmatimonadota bacterium]
MSEASGPLPCRLMAIESTLPAEARDVSRASSRTPGATASWSAEDAAELYQVPYWGNGYFAVSDEGHVVVRPDPAEAREIDLLEVVEGLRERDLHPPVLIRFSDILAHRLRHLHAAFDRAIAENEYRGRYLAVYPIKVNQQRPVVDEVFRYGQRYGFGLEVGSKPELLAVMAMSDTGERPIICNGFKDDAYIEAVILATKLGRTIIPVIENFEEFGLVLKYSEQYGVRPKIGVRTKLASSGAGRWSDSAGQRSKFGLFVSEVLHVWEDLVARDMGDCLKLLHCHPGSQIQDIRALKDAVAELAHIFGELVELGAGLEYIDVGGGLGVDYDGSQSSALSSINYTLREYASEVVYRVGSVCDERGIRHPTIVTESGRAIAAYHSVLVFNVLGKTGPAHYRSHDLPAGAAAELDDLPQPIRDLIDAYNSVGEDRLVEPYHDAITARDQAIHLFGVGYLSLALRGLAERLFWATCSRARDVARTLEYPPEELAELESILSEIYFCNLSIFQSLPDAWAIDQLFPVMPIHRLDARPTQRGVLADITCDSDGKIDRFIDAGDVKGTLELHELEPGKEYYLAAFLVGAYQETLGDL